jgi:hypothetical protein
MLNRDNRHFQLSARNLDEARQIALAPFAGEIERLDRTLVTLQGLADSPDRNALIGRVHAARKKWAALKNERRANFDRALETESRTGQGMLHYINLVLDLLDGNNAAHALGLKGIDPRFNGASPPVENGITSSIRGHAIAEERRRCLRRAGARRLYLVARLSLQAAVVGRPSPRDNVPKSHAQSMCNRSMASRSRMIAPVGAPPSDC